MTLSKGSCRLIKAGCVRYPVMWLTTARPETATHHDVLSFFVVFCEWGCVEAEEVCVA